MEYENDLPDLYKKKNILGSKPCSESPTTSENDSEPTIRECSIVLQDFPIVPKDVVCKYCNEIFPDENALIKHSLSTNTCHKQLFFNTLELKPKKIEDDTEVVPNEEKSNCSIAKYISCEICFCLFKFNGHYLNHMKKCHGVERDKLPNPAINNFQCRFCPHVATDNTEYNNHICHCHNKLYTKKVSKNNSNQFKCDLCNVSFLTAHSEKIHRALYHPDISKINKKLFEGKEIKMKFFAKFRSDNSRPIPRSTLFSCDKCQIHFVSCLAAWKHSKRCVLTKGDWKCKKCRRSFKMVDRDAHLKQHEVSDRLKVIKVREGILDRILCRCLSCKICFDERNLLKYHSFGCPKDNSVSCTVCPVRIHEHAIEKHKRIHSKLGPEQPFIVIDFISNDKTTSKALSEEPTLTKRKVNAFYYYCPSCKLCMKINRLSDNHSTGECNNRAIRKRLCKLCGLCFTRRGYESHAKDHKFLPNLKLSDIMIRNIQTGEKVDPPFPAFKKCKKCKVCFFSSVALRSHVCHAEKVKICDYCGENLSDLAYKLHVPFHEYRKQKKMENELIKKYESLKTIWNILYLCATCDTVLDSYDDVVEHSQNHFCNMQHYSVTINHCAICDLKFMGKSYERHVNLHAGNISKSSFEIIKFNYETLVSDKWLDMFTTIVPEKVDQILKKSIYKDTRSARMTVLDPKESEFRLYQCGVCNVMVESNKIIHHAHNRKNCIKPKNISCNLCQFKFDSKNALNSHQLLHENLQIDAMDFKIISFNNEKDAYVNNSLKSVMNPESLKLIRCLHWKKLINKVKYSKHVINHRYSEMKKREKMKKPKFVVRPKFKNAGIAPHSFYVCKLCGVCVFKQNIKIHFCRNNNQKTQCNKCLLWFRASNIQKHNLYHEKYKFTKGVNVVYFKNGVIESNVVQSKTVLYQCKECKTCLHRKYNIPRHKCVSFKYLKQCNLCEVAFHSFHFYFHVKLHYIKSFSKKDVTIRKFTPISNNKNLMKPKSEAVDFETSPLNTPFAFCLSKTNSEEKEIVSKEFIKNIANDDKTNYELTDVNFHKRLYGRLFQCKNCQLLFLTGSALVKHAKCCDEDRDSIECQCGLVFHSSALKFHQKWQRCEKSGRTGYFILTLISENVVDFDLRKCLYTCRNCGVYYLSLDTALRHVEDYHPTILTLVKCEQCNLPFTAMSNTKHNKFHHETHNWSLSDLILFEVQYVRFTDDFSEDSICDESFASTTSEPSSERKSVEKEHVERPVVGNKDLKIGPNNEAVVSETSPQNTPFAFCLSKTNSEEKEIVSKEFMKNIAHGDETNYELTDVNFHKRLYGRLFQCKNCQLLFLTGSALVKHAKCCDEDRDSIECQCGLVFHSSALKLHQKWQRCEKSERTEYFIVTLISENVVDFDLRKCLYTCRKCGVYYLSLDTALRHFEDNHPTIQTLVKCEQCNLPFTAMSNTKHNKFHHETYNWSLSDLILFEVQYVRFTDDFSEDSICDESFASTTNEPSSERKSVEREHVERPVVGNKDLKIGPNNEAVVSETSPQNTPFAFCLSKTNSEEIEIVSKEFIKNIANDDKTNYELTDVSFLRRLPGRLFQCKNCQLLFITGSALVKHAKCCDGDRDSIECQCGLVFHSSALKLHQKWQLCEKSERTEYFIVTLISENVVDFDLRKCLYTCRKCGVYYLSINTALRHFEKNHLIIQTLVKCEQCNLPFTAISNTKHNSIHHETYNWSLSDLILFEVQYVRFTDDSSEDSMSDESFASTDSEPSSERKSVKRQHVERPVVGNKVLKIGPNNEAVVSETSPLNTPYILPGTCDTRNVYKCDICDLSFVHKDTLRTHYNVGLHDQHRLKCKCGLSFTVKSLRRHLKLPSDLPLRQIEKLLTSVKQDELNESQNSEVTEKPKITPKLFKCSNCDVYFLTDEVCQDHITNHQVLDPTEYIACKICELQFLCEYLGAHMRTHRDKTFNIEELMVTEFQPDKHTVDTYRAIDRLKSKAVSTTTHFDTEDEKSESVD